MLLFVVCGWFVLMWRAGILVVLLCGRKMTARLTIWNCAGVLAFRWLCLVAGVFALRLVSFPGVVCWHLCNLRILASLQCLRYLQSLQSLHPCNFSIFAVFAIFEIFAYVATCQNYRPVHKDPPPMRKHPVRGLFLNARISSHICTSTLGSLLGQFGHVV